MHDPCPDRSACHSQASKSRFIIPSPCCPWYLPSPPPSFAPRPKNGSRLMVPPALPPVVPPLASPVSNPDGLRNGDELSRYKGVCSELSFAELLEPQPSFNLVRRKSGCEHGGPDLVPHPRRLRGKNGPKFFVPSYFLCNQTNNYTSFEVWR